MALARQAAARGSFVESQMLLEVLEDLAPQQGVDKAVVEARTVLMTYNGVEGDCDAAVDAPDAKGEMCMVCLEHFQDGDSLRIMPCSHRYHRTCVDAWLAVNKYCPICKYDVTV